MEPRDAFLFKDALVEAGWSSESAEKVVAVMEKAMATHIDAVLAKWTAEAKRDHAELRRDLEVVKRELLASAIAIAGLVLAAIKWL